MYMHKYAEKTGSDYSGIPWRTVVVGARGYAGLELSRLLLRHPLARLEACAVSGSDFELKNYLLDSGAEQVPTWSLNELNQWSEKVDLVFLATPAEVSLELAPKFLAAGVHVIDLSGAYRLNQGDQKQKYKNWYNLEHSHLAGLANAEFGLQPWCNAKTKATPNLIANPGCYATSILMALIPLLKGGLVDPAGLVIDAKSGTTGAGRKASEAMLFAEVAGDCRPYKVGKHQHTPEIVDTIAALTGIQIDPHFTTHLLSVRRGIVSSIYANLLAQFASLSDQEAEGAIARCYQEAYASYPLVKFAPIRENEGLLSLKKVVGSPRTHLSFQVTNGKLYLFALIDNLLKGAASQAIENLNKLMDQPLASGLDQVEGVL